MEAYLFLAPLLLLPVLFLWRLTGCTLLFPFDYGSGNVGSCLRSDLTACEADEHVVEFVVIFDPAGRAKEDLRAVYELTPTISSASEAQEIFSPSEECPNDFGFPGRDPEGRERFVFFHCVKELTEGQYRIRCRIEERDSGFLVIEGDCIGGPPDRADLRVQFVGSAGDLTLRNTRCFAAP